jgi:RNA polymerase sigma-70 factor (ECF subfamily)
MQTKREKLETYVTENINKIYRLAFSYVKNEHDAEDIVNESVRKALDGIEQLRNEEFLGTWFFRIVINTSNTYLKSKSKLIYLDEIVENSLTTEDKYQDTDLYDAVMKLDSKYRIVIILKFYEDMTIERISEVLDENISTVKTKLYKALKKLRLEIDREDMLDEKPNF